jgi:hypothetical protein
MRTRFHEQAFALGAGLTSISACPFPPRKSRAACAAAAQLGGECLLKCGSIHLHVFECKFVQCEAIRALVFDVSVEVERALLVKMIRRQISRASKYHKRSISPRDSTGA